MSDQGHGVAVAFDTGYFAAIRSVQWSGMSRAEIDTTSYATTEAKTNQPAALYDPGSIEIEGFFAPATGPAIADVGGATAETCTVTWTDSGGTTWACSGFMSEFSIDAGSAEERVMFSATLRLSGDITIT
jgi:hypothetical protein